MKKFFPRPKPQKYISDIFLKSIKYERNVFVYIDSYYEGHPDYIRPDKRYYIWREDGFEAQKKGTEIFKDAIEQLKENDWRVIMLSNSIYLDGYAKIIKDDNKLPFRWLRQEEIIDNSAALLLFVATHRVYKKSIYPNNENAISIFRSFLRNHKKICTIDQFGVKRYPRTPIINLFPRRR